MKHPIAMACAVACAGCIGTVAAQDLAQTAGSNAKVVLDNADVRVIELNMPVGASTGKHEHKTDQLVVFLTDGTARQTGADGESKTLTRKAGEVAWSAPTTHDTLNAGDKPVRTLVIELKK
ncbi:cupin domain-containing protein [Lysobacter changpingensis]|uniref:cupin domain-containing protein n=1 Tax=Lysobacter changpingensis TaxID=2792784 RepID=UPI001A8DD637|nr:cupin domain-containing protein [Lysobacter changpingensis]